MLKEIRYFTRQYSMKIEKPMEKIQLRNNIQIIAQRWLTVQILNYCHGISNENNKNPLWIF